MRHTSRSHFPAVDEAVLLLLYGACWLVALFTLSVDHVVQTRDGLELAPGQTGPATAARVLSAVAFGIVLASWVCRPATRLGWRGRDVWPVLLVVLAVVEAYRAPIRHVALLELFHILHLAAIFITSAYLCARRPQPLFAITLFLLILASVLAWRWGESLFPSLDPVRLTQITALAALAWFPWLIVRGARSWHRWYPWAVLAVAAGVLAVEAAGKFPGASGSWIQSFGDVMTGDRQPVIAAIAGTSWPFGCGPSHFGWICRANVPGGSAVQAVSEPGALLIFLELGAIGLVLMTLFGVSLLWRFRPGPWGTERRALLDLARPLRWVAAYTFLVMLATPLYRTPFGQVVLWSLFGMLRAFSSARPPAAVSLLDGTIERGESGAQDSRAPAWRWRETVLLTGALLAGCGLAINHVRPWIAQRRLRQTAKANFHEIAYLERVELARWWWPYDPQNYKFEAVHLRARATAQGSLSATAVEAITLAYEQMIRANPYDAFAHHRMARWHIDLQERWKKEPDGLQKAIQTTRRGLIYCPASFELQYLLAGCYRRTGAPHKALEAYERARRLRPNSLPVLLNLARIEIQLGNRLGAERYLRLAQQVAPNPTAIQPMLDAVRSGEAGPAPLDQPFAEPEAGIVPQIPPPRDAP